MVQYPVGTRVLYTHKKYSISYNGPNIIHVNLTYSDVLTSIASNKHVPCLTWFRLKALLLTIGDAYSQARRVFV